MLPEFPEFKNLELSDREDIEKITMQYAPYSDFNFVSMWSYDNESKMQISQLHGNFVVKFADYETGEPFYTFLGSNETTDTARQLLELSEKENLEPVLKLLPEISVQGIDQSAFKATEDRDHFDYIMGAEKLANMEVGHIRSHSNFNQRFIDEHGDLISTRILDLNDPAERENIAVLTDVWMHNKTAQKKSFLSHLDEVVKRYLLVAEHLRHENLIAVGVFHDGKLVGCTISEFTGPDYAVCHFMKCDNSFKGIYSHLVMKTCQEISKTGRKYINFEQDMGWPNLRQSKKTYEPVAFLKKYNLKKI
jgi:hypothetical protein